MGTINENSQWFYCRICGSKTRTKVCENTVVFHFPQYCPKCKTEVRIDIMQLKMTISK